MKRHKAALAIQQGARNVRAIARSLVEASDEAAREGIGAEKDAAVRMIVHQLAQVCNVDEIKYGYDPESLKDVYCILMSECEERAKEIVVAPEHVSPMRPVSTCAPKGTGSVAVVLHDAGEAVGKREPEPPAGFAPASESRRGILSRFLFGGD